MSASASFHAPRAHRAMSSLRCVASAIPHTLCLKPYTSTYTQRDTDTVTVTDTDTDTDTDTHTHINISYYIYYVL
jgi:hypothetical protein